MLNPGEVVELSQQLAHSAMFARPALFRGTSFHHSIRRLMIPMLSDSLPF
jgi:hypothetical protein